MELRKCCNHPYLVKGAEAQIAKHFIGESPLEIMVQSSGKLMLLDKLLPKLKNDGHRVLIFSQFRIMLNIIEDYMNLRGYSYERVDGEVTGKKRQCAIDRYQNPNGGAFAMLLSTR
jgi:SNF2 family DNA or RNA helicase